MLSKGPYVTMGVLLTLAGCSGCILNVSSRSTRTGTFVPLRLTDQLVVGETTKDWVLDNLGAPNSITEKSDGSEILKYQETRRKRDHVGIFLLMDIKNVTETQHVLTIEVKNGLVQDYHRDVSESEDGFDVN